MNVTKCAIKSFLTLFAICRVTQIHTTNPITILLFVILLYIYSRFTQPSFEYKIASADPIHASVMALIFTTLTMFAKCYDMINGLSNLFFCISVWIITVIGLLIMYYHTMIWIYTITESVKIDTVLYPNKILPLIAFVACIIGWLPYYLFEYPGIMTAESMEQYAQAIGTIELNNYHSIIYTYLIQFFNSIGVFFFKNAIAGIAVFTFAQLLFMAFVAGYVVKTLQKAKLHTTVCIITILFYALMPYIAIHSVNVLKDTLFAGNVVLLSCSIIRLLIRSDRYTMSTQELFCEVIPYILSAFMISLLHANGWYAFLASLPFIIIGFREKLKMIIPMNLIVIVLVLFVKYPFMTVYEIKQADYVESLSIPVQQIARVVSAGQTLTEEQATELAQYIDIDQIPLRYSPDVSDGIKDLIRETGNDYLENHKKDFLKLWLDIGADHPHAYFDAYIDQTIGFWYPEIQHEVTLANGIAQNDMDIESKPIINGNVVAKIKEAIFKIQNVVPLYGLLWSMGFIFWILIIIISICLRNSKFNNTVPTLPVLFIIIIWTMTTPVAWEFRYAFALFFGLPLYTMLPFMNPEY